MKAKDRVHSHSYEHFEDLQLSAKEFYQSITDQLTEYQYPQVGHYLKEINEFSAFSTRRQYLVIHRYELQFMICAAPFGRSYFISWWMKDKRNNLSEFLRKIPLLGRLFSGDPSYYAIDTAMIFSNSIDAIVKHAVDRVKAEHGFRQSANALAGQQA
jgi:hypothetical protein